MLHGILRTRHGASLNPPRHRLIYGLQHIRCLCCLAIETSCDDTCVAILEKGRQDDSTRCPALNRPLAELLFHEKITSDNSAYQGIHPIEALESHSGHLAKLVSRSLAYLPTPGENQRHSKNIALDTGDIKAKPDFIAVTRGPGMRSNLSCGLDTAKGLATAWQIPLVAVHHMQAHALTSRLAMALTKLHEPEGSISRSIRDATYIEPTFPFLTLLVSGGHTLLVHSEELTEHSILASTVDTAVGDALDKVGRLVVPKETLDGTRDTAFAKHLSAYAFRSPQDYLEYPIPVKRCHEVQKSRNQYGWHVQVPFAETRELAFSFTGITSRIESLWKQRQVAEEGLISDDERRLFARTAIGVAFEHLGSRTIIALEKLRRESVELSSLVVSGGVAANDFLRYFLREMLNARGFEHVRLIFPPPDLCTDNAAMIAWAGMEMFEAGFVSDLGCNAVRKWSMDSRSDDGGILGVKGHVRSS